MDKAIHFSLSHILMVAKGRSFPLNLRFTGLSLTEMSRYITLRTLGFEPWALNISL